MIKLSLLLLAFYATFLSASDAPSGNAPLRSWSNYLPPRVARAVLRLMRCWQLDRTLPVHGAQLIVLSEHVDYWNHIGWTDPYSSRFFSDRQNAYSDRFGLRTVYTPQMVVDGNAEFVGGDRQLAGQAVQKALSLPKVAVRISGNLAGHFEGLHAHIDTDALPDSLKLRKADVYVVVALNHAESQVLRGENSGHRLSHVGVVQSLTKIGNLRPERLFRRMCRSS